MLLKTHIHMGLIHLLWVKHPHMSRMNSQSMGLIPFRVGIKLLIDNLINLTLPD